MELEIGPEHAYLSGFFDQYGMAFVQRLEGRKHYKDDRLKFEATPHNLRVIKQAFPEMGNLQVDPADQPKIGGSIDPQFRLPPRDYQLENFERFKDAPACAIFSDPGTGKTKTALDIVSWRWHAKLITGVLVLSSPKGVHAQWIEEQLPLHLWENVPVLAAWWNGKKAPNWTDYASMSSGDLRIFSGNIEMLVSEKGCEVIDRFLAAHGDKAMIIVDESDSIKNWSAKRSKKLRELAKKHGVKYRMIMTGTPIAKDLTDEWAQFYFLNPNIIGHKYKTSFQAQFCVMGGFENRHVVAHRNVDQFKEITAPFIFRANKEALNLPPKIYDTVQFDLTDEQTRLIKEIRDTCIGVLDSEGDRRVLASTAATAILRMHQISCGFAMADGEEEPHTLDGNPRLAVLLDLLEQLGEDRRAIIWCRFRNDELYISNTLGTSAVSIHGGKDMEERMEAKQRFIHDPDVRYLVATPDAGGKGMDGLQAACSTAIYYSNSYNAILRWQSEDRIHRIGQRGTASYFDLIARGSPDKAILRNLKAKKDLSTLVLDDMRKIIEGRD